MNEYLEKNPIIKKVILTAWGMLALFLLVSTIVKLKEGRFVGSGLNATNTITVQGEGKIERAPDTAKVSFTVRSEAKDLKTAQNTVSEKMAAVTSALKELGIEEKYIKTESYSSYPQYEYSTVRCYGCPQGNPTIRGYEVAHNVTVAVKDLEKVNDVLAALGTAGVSDISGPNFGFEDDKAIAREARDHAIEDAKDEAQKLAKSLGVRLVRIVSFSENGNTPYPMYAESKVSNQDAVGAAAPTIPIGDQKIQSTVTIVYEIR